MKLTQKFIKGLAAYGLTYDDVKQNWKYAGGDTGHHSNYYYMAFSHLQQPEHTDRCVCDHVMQENCYTTDGTDMIAVGNCCIKKFVNQSGRTCDKCGEPHKNRKVNRCNLCREEYGDRTYKCDKCGEPHTNRFVNRCESCRRGCCDSCDCPINPNYRECYSCHIKDN